MKRALLVFVACFAACQDAPTFTLSPTSKVTPATQTEATASAPSQPGAALTAPPSTTAASQPSAATLATVPVKEEPPAKPLTRCPKTFKTKDIGRACSFAAGYFETTKACRFKEASCSCDFHPAPSGAMWIEEERKKRYLNSPQYYSCEVTDPSLLQENGCPYRIPSGACEKEGLSCRYRKNSGGTDALCKDGQWSLTKLIEPRVP